MPDNEKTAPTLKELATQLHQDMRKSSDKWYDDLVTIVNEELPDDVRLAAIKQIHHKMPETYPLKSKTPQELLAAIVPKGTLRTYVKNGGREKIQGYGDKAAA